MAEWTIQKLLNWITDYFTEKSLDSPRLCAEMLLAETLGLRRIDLYTRFDQPVSQQDRDRLRDLVKRAADHEPVQYLIGKTEFYSMQFQVSPAVLIPRPETELLVERAIEYLRSRTGKQFICDLCTGSGCIAAAIAKNHPDCRVIATDICSDALEIAAANIEKHNLTEKVELLQGDLSSRSSPTSTPTNSTLSSRIHLTSARPNTKTYPPTSANTNLPLHSVRAKPGSTLSKRSSLRHPHT